MVDPVSSSCPIQLGREREYPFLEMIIFDWVSYAIKTYHQINVEFVQGRMSFEPKHKVELDPPKDDPISTEFLAKCDG